MGKRQVFHSVPKSEGWAVTRGGKTVSNHNTQRASEAAAIKLGHKAENSDGLGQAVLHKSNGRASRDQPLRPFGPHRATRLVPAQPLLTFGKRFQGRCPSPAFRLLAAAGSVVATLAKLGGRH
jgi:hypothetical protein